MPQASTTAARRVWLPAARWLAVILAGAAVLYAAVLAWLWLYQESLLFAPTVLPASFALAREGDVHELTVNVPGARLSVLQLRLASPKGVVFYLHGNAGSLANWFSNAGFYRRANYDLVMMDYRGFGKSSGRIESEEQLRADVRAVWDQVAPMYAGRRVVIYGRSLGTGLAAGLAADLARQGHAPDLTVLASPYSSMQALAAEQFPWVPAAVLRYPLRTLDLIGNIRGPLLLLHGEQDTLIPPAHSEALKAAAAQARLVIVPGAGHNDLQKFEAYLRAWSAALADL